MTQKLIDRRCEKCGETKPIEQFPVRTRNRSGFGGVCKSCSEPSPIEGLDPRDIRRMCEGKQRMNTREAAQNVVIKHALKHRGQRVRAYHCPICDGWHVTTKSSVRAEKKLRRAQLATKAKGE